MASSARDVARKELKTFWGAKGTGDEFQAMFAELVQERNDRACAVLCANLLDDALRGAIASSLRQLNSDEYDRIFDVGAPLSTFSAKIDMAYAFQVIERDARKNLNVIRDVRNAFAHSLKPLTFNTPVVKRYCTFLKPPPDTGADNEHPRSTYLLTALDITTNLLQLTMGKQRIRALTDAIRNYGPPAPSKDK